MVPLWNSYIVLQKTRGAARSIKQNLGAWYAVKYLSTQAVEVTSGFNGSSIISSNKKAVPHKAIHEMYQKYYLESKGKGILFPSFVFRLKSLSCLKSLYNRVVWMPWLFTGVAIDQKMLSNARNSKILSFNNRSKECLTV